jgi:hypothetical protein
MINDITVVNFDVRKVNDKEQSRFVNVSNDIYRLKKYCEVQSPVIICNEKGNFLVLHAEEDSIERTIERYKEKEVFTEETNIKIFNTFRGKHGRNTDF